MGQYKTKLQTWRQNKKQKQQMMKLVASVAALALVVSVEGYNEDSGLDKWSPSYFNYRYFPQQTYKRRGEAAQALDISSSQGYNPSWFVGSQGTLYRKRFPSRESWSLPSSTGRSSCAA